MQSIQEIGACGLDDPSPVCLKFFEWTGNETLSGLSAWVIDRPARVVIIGIIAWLLNRMARRTIGALSDQVRTTPSHPRLRQLRELGPGFEEMNQHEADRAPARAEAIESVLKSLVSTAIWTLAVLIMLGEFEVNLAPLVAGAGIVGIAVGFGAQSIVADFLAGTFMLIEDQYGIGDVIEVAGATGEVESISLRTTKLRDQSGTVWHIPNGEIKRVGNHSQLWSNAVVDMTVAYDSDLRQAMHLMAVTAEDLRAEHRSETRGPDIISDPAVLGVQELGPSAITLRMVVRTDPQAQWRVERELRLRLKEAFDTAGIAIPFPQREVRIVGGDTVSGGPVSGDTVSDDTVSDDAVGHDA